MDEAKLETMYGRLCSRMDPDTWAVSYSAMTYEGQQLGLRASAAMREMAARGWAEPLKDSAGYRILPKAEPEPSAPDAELWHTAFLESLRAATGDDGCVPEPRHDAANLPRLVAARLTARDEWQDGMRLCYPTVSGRWEQGERVSKDVRPAKMDAVDLGDLPTLGLIAALHTQMTGEYVYLCDAAEAYLNAEDVRVTEPEDDK